MQVLTACLKSFAHGANDTANAAGPLAAIAVLHGRGLDTCERVTTPFWVLAWCGVGLVAGLSLFGSRVSTGLLLLCAELARTC